MNKIGKVLIFIVLLFILILGVEYIYKKKEPTTLEQFPGRERKSVTIRGQNFDVVVSRTQEELTQGLSNTRPIKENEGMLFIFPKPGNYNFWMKDMNYPIDMLWIDKEKKIIFIQKNATPESYPESFGPRDGQALMVLEIGAGFSNKLGITVGDSVVIQ